MAGYVLSGYTTPTGVNSASAVKAMQRELGVKADGVWGPNTQAAYESSKQQPTASYPAYTNYTASASGGSSQLGAQIYRESTPSGRQATAFTAGPTTSAGVSATSVGNRQAGYVEHVSGYTGQGYRDEKGRYYTDYGALLREDGFFYPTGAIVSPNGMYYDDGNGWQYANHAKTSDGRYVASATASTGVAPGTTIFSVDKEEQERMRIAASVAAAASASKGAYNTIETELGASTPPVSASEEWKNYFDREIELYRKKLLEGYGVQ